MWKYDWYIIKYDYILNISDENYIIIKNKKTVFKTK